MEMLPSSVGSWLQEKTHKYCLLLMLFANHFCQTAFVVTLTATYLTNLTVSFPLKIHSLGEIWIYLKKSLRLQIEVFPPLDPPEPQMDYFALAMENISLHLTSAFIRPLLASSPKNTLMSKKFPTERREEKGENVIAERTRDGCAVFAELLCVVL